MPAGRPPKYKTAEKLQEKIDQYFKDGFRVKIIKKFSAATGRMIEYEVPKITITDLVLYLGFADRTSFYDMEKMSKFSYTIKRARTFIEREYEEQLDINPTGAIFALKNFSWTDKTESDVNMKADFNINIISYSDNPNKDE